MVPLLLATYTAGGLALLRRRTAPLGLVLLAPIVVIIFFTDALLSSVWWWGGWNAAVMLALAWRFRAAFRPLWNYSAARAEAP